MKLLLASVPFVALVLQVTPIQAQQKNENKAEDVRTSPEIRSVKTTISGETQINYRENDHWYKIKMSGSKILEIYIDDKKVAEEDYSKYDATIKKILAQIEKDREQAEKDRQQAQLDREQARKDRQQATEDRRQAEKNREQADKDREQAERDREQARKDREQANSSRERSVKDKQQAQNDRERSETDRQRADKDRLQAVEDRKQAEKDREQAGKDRQQAEVDRKRAEEDRKLMNAMIDEIVKEKVIDNEDALKSLRLDENELIVNDIKQPENLHNKFKAKYLKSGRSKISYKNSDGFRGISIDQ